MKSKFGNSIHINNDIETGPTDMPADVRIAIGDRHILITPAQARKLARKLEKHADKVDAHNRLRVQR